MKSSTPGTNTSDIEVVQISGHGLWLDVRGAEYFLPFDDFPWFRTATVADILNVELLHGDHLHWPALDVDLCMDSLNDPVGYPLVYR